MTKFIIKEFIKFNENRLSYFERTGKSLSNFTDEELQIVKDIFQTYIDVFDMMEMPTDDNGEVSYDPLSDRIQYYIQSYVNIGINIESRSDLNDVYDNIMSNIDSRLKPFGFYVYAHDLDKGFVDKIDITIMKINED